MPDSYKYIIEIATSEPHSRITTMIYQMTQSSLKHVTSVLVGCFWLVTLDFLNHANLIVDLCDPGKRSGFKIVS